MLFAELTYTLATEEAERIGVDHVARMTATGTGENSTGTSYWDTFLPFEASTLRVSLYTQQYHVTCKPSALQHCF